MASQYNTAAIRELLSAAFSDEDISTLTFDYFPSVYESFSSGMSKGAKIQTLIDYCQRHELVPRLLETVRKSNPAQYNRYRTRLETGERAVSQATSSSQEQESLRRQLAEARANLRLIEERKDEYVMGVEVPLQLIKEERRLQEKIAELEQRLDSASDETL